MFFKTVVSNHEEIGKHAKKINVSWINIHGKE